MFMIQLKCVGDYSRTSNYLKKIRQKKFDKYIYDCAEEGLTALKSATPVDTGLTAESWYYTIDKSNNKVAISFNNSNRNNGVMIAIILQYGHGTRNGGWVEGRDYINPAIQPVFDKIVNKIWGEVKNA